MKKGDIVVYALLLLIVIGSLAGAMLLKRSEGDRHLIIEVNRRLIHDIPLKKGARDQEIRVNTGNGGYNIVRIRGNRVDVAEANCPDQICVEWGSIQNVGETIVCLPHKMTVKIIGEKSDTGIDELAS